LFSEERQAELAVIIRQRLYELGEARPIAHQSPDSSSFFHQNGFMIHNSVISFDKNDKKTIKKLKKKFLSRPHEYVFNEGFIDVDQSTPSAQRRQIITHKIDEDLRSQHFGEKCAKFLSNIEQQAADVVGPILPGDHQLLSTETVLFSCKNSNLIQDPHCDLGRKYIDNSLLAFVPLESNTTIIVYPGSHIESRKKRRSYLIPRRISILPGDLFIFHPRLIHCGDAYVHSNIRLHYYFFDRPHFNWSNVTFPVMDGMLRLMEVTSEEYQWIEQLRIGKEAAHQQRNAAAEKRLENMCIARSHLRHKK
jgi:hypothetical protein